MLRHLDFSPQKDLTLWESAIQRQPAVQHQVRLSQHLPQWQHQGTQSLAPAVWKLHRQPCIKTLWLSVTASQVQSNQQHGSNWIFFFLIRINFLTFTVRMSFLGSRTRKWQASSHRGEVERSQTYGRVNINMHTVWETHTFTISLHNNPVFM